MDDLQWLSDDATLTLQRIQFLGGGSNMILEEHLASLVVHPVMNDFELLEERATYTINAAITSPAHARSSSPMSNLDVSSHTPQLRKMLESSLEQSFSHDTDRF
ncbi:hypothetical protein N7G274_003920 [Stereocaulon virgatum]|uniref:Uncharacterized protein n=1 Tax=Stereocaulon virgatum TaxID=373712 RepID=A0ABR4AJM4_9LECA